MCTGLAYAVLCCAVLCCLAAYWDVLDCIVRCSNCIILHGLVLYCVTLGRRELCCLVLVCVVSSGIVLCLIGLCCILLWWVVLCCVVLCCIVLVYCIAWFCVVFD